MNKWFSFYTMILFSHMSVLTPALAQVKLETYPDKIIYFGHGGGFTGQVNKYALLANGEIYKTLPFHSNEFLFLKNLQATQLDSILLNLEFLGIDTLRLNEPGNTYSFITLLNESKQEHRLVWNKSIQVPGNLILFFEQLLALIPSP